ncbi:MAG: AarF/ABC1/UbiB kinase family protein, partial [Bdellovibrio sp.]|nr:AarF/ABC1/UbiB kinase family protein [Bdellovibrio sp.]
MLKRLSLIAVGLIFICRFASAMVPDSVGLYLSFEQRLVLSYALLAQGESEQNKSEIIKRGKSYLARAVAAGVQTVKVNSFEEFLSHFRGQWPDTQSVALDLEVIEHKAPMGIRIFVSDSPRIQRKIYEYLEWQQEHLEKQLQRDGVLGVKMQERFRANVLPRGSTGRSEQTLALWALGESEAFLGERM